MGCEACLLKARYALKLLSCRDCPKLHKIERVIRSGPYPGLLVLELLLKEVQA